VAPLLVSLMIRTEAQREEKEIYNLENEIMGSPQTEMCLFVSTASF